MELLELSSEYELLASDKQASALANLQDCVFAPAINSALIEPCNAIASSINAVTVGIKGAKDGIIAGSKHAAEIQTSADLIPKLKELKTPSSKFLSTGWVVESAAAGLGMLIPYTIAGRAAGGCLRALSSSLNLKGSSALFIQHEASAQILGAALYDGMRETRSGETRMGNALGGAAGFGIFEAGNAAARNMPVASRLLTRAFAGSIGAMTNQSIAKLYSSGNLPDNEMLLKAGIGGMFMNTFLPESQRAVSRALDSSRMPSKAVELDSDALNLSVKPMARMSTERFKDENLASSKSESPDKLPETNPNKPIPLTPEGDSHEYFWISKESEDAFHTYEEYLDRHVEYEPIHMNNWSMAKQTKIVYPSFAYPEYDRISLQKLANAISELPSPSELKSITVMDQPHFREKWIASQQGTPEYRIFGEIDDFNNVTLYRPSNAMDLSTTLQHEFGHALKVNHPVEGDLFDKVNVEMPVRIPNADARNLEGRDEAWAHFAEVLLSEPKLMSHATAYANPIHAVVLGKALRNSLANNAEPGPRLQDHLELLDFIERDLRPRAMEQLKIMSDKDLSKRVASFSNNPD